MADTAPHPALATAEEMDLFAHGAEVVADPGFYFELGPEHTPGAEWCALNLRVPGHRGRVRICATMVERPSAAAAPPPLPPPPVIAVAELVPLPVEGVLPPPPVLPPMPPVVMRADDE